MKQCPSCRTTYTDDTLRFCLADGSPLESAGAEHLTQVRSGVPPTADKTVAFSERDKLRIDLGSENTRTVPPPPYPAGTSTNKGSGGLLKIAAILAALFVLALLGAGAVGLVVYFSSQQTGNVAVNKNSAALPVPSNSPRTANGTDELRDQIANLQRQLDQQKNNRNGTNAMPLSTPNTPGPTTTARANSPRDGFLALRSLPNTEIGDRIAKIPHGAPVAIGACGPVMRSGSRSGRWCQASYDGVSGWVFDAYLSY